MYNRSIMSHCTTTGPISSDCPDLLNRTYSLGRYGASGNHHGCYHSSPYTTMTNGYSSNHHLHGGGQHQYQNGKNKNYYNYFKILHIFSYSHIQNKKKCNNSRGFHVIIIDNLYIMRQDLEVVVVLVLMAVYKRAFHSPSKHHQ